MDNITVIAAWWGAVLATILAIFEFYKRWKDESIDFSIKVSRYFRLPRSSGYVPVHVEVVNRGKRTVNIREVLIEDRSKCISQSDTVQGELWTAFNSFEEPLPRTLETGRLWIGESEIDITELLVSSLGPNIFVSVYHSHSDHPIRVPFKPRDIY